MSSPPLQQPRNQFLQREVDAARASTRDGQGESNAVVEAEFAARARVADRA